MIQRFISVYGISKIFVLGLNIDEAREQISNEINSLYPGSKISTLLSVNTIQVYALGLVNKPEPINWLRHLNPSMELLLLVVFKKMHHLEI